MFKIVIEGNDTGGAKMNIEGQASIGQVVQALQWAQQTVLSRPIQTITDPSKMVDPSAQEPAPATTDKKVDTRKRHKPKSETRIHSDVKIDPKTVKIDPEEAKP